MNQGQSRNNAAGINTLKKIAESAMFLLVIFGSFLLSCKNTYQQSMAKSPLPVLGIFAEREIVWTRLDRSDTAHLLSDANYNNYSPGLITFNGILLATFTRDEPMAAFYAYSFNGPDFNPNWLLFASNYTGSLEYGAIFYYNSLNIMYPSPPNSLVGRRFINNAWDAAGPPFDYGSIVKIPLECHGVSHNSIIHLTWIENKDGFNLVRMKSTNMTGSMTNGPEVSTGGIDEEHFNHFATPCLASSGHFLYAAYINETYSSNRMIKVRRYNGSVWSSLPPDPLNPSQLFLNHDLSKSAYNPTIAFDGFNIYAAWVECMPGNVPPYRLCVRRFNGISWDFIDGGYQRPQGLIWLDTNTYIEKPQLVVINGKLVCLWLEWSNGASAQLRAAVYEGFGGGNGNPWKYIDGEKSTGLNIDPNQSVISFYAAAFGGRLFVHFIEYSPAYGRNVSHVKAGL
jgi:hypothetical protein